MCEAYRVVAMRSATMYTASSSEQPRSRMMAACPAFSCFSVMASAGSRCTSASTSGSATPFTKGFD